MYTRRYHVLACASKLSLPISEKRTATSNTSSSSENDCKLQHITLTYNFWIWIWIFPAKWATKKKNVTFHHTDWFNKDPYTGLP